MKSIARPLVINHLPSSVLHGLLPLSRWRHDVAACYELLLAC